MFTIPPCFITVPEIVYKIQGEKKRARTSSRKKGGEFWDNLAKLWPRIDSACSDRHS